MEGDGCPIGGTIDGLKCPSDREGGADGIESDIFMIRFGETTVGDVLVKDAEIDRELIHNRDSYSCPDCEAEAEVLSLGIGGAGGICEHETDPGLKVRDNGPSFLDEVVAWTEQASREPGVGTMDYGGVHAAEEEFCIATVPAFISDLIQLPSHGDELGEIPIIVRVVDGKESGCFGREADHVLAKEAGGIGNWGLGAGVVDCCARPTCVHPRDNHDQAKEGG